MKTATSIWQKIDYNLITLSGNSTELPPFTIASSDILLGTNADDLIDTLEGNDQINECCGHGILNGGPGLVEVTFDIKGGIEANAKIEFEKQNNGPTNVL